MLEINSRSLQFNSLMNLEKVNNLMNDQFNMNRFLQLKIVPRALLVNQYKKKYDDTQSNYNDAIRTVSLFYFYYYFFEMYFVILFSTGH